MLGVKPSASNSTQERPRRCGTAQPLVYANNWLVAEVSARGQELSSLCSSSVIVASALTLNYRCVTTYRTQLVRPIYTTQIYQKFRMLLGHHVTVHLVCTLVLVRLDYCNAVYVGVPAVTLAPLPQVFHSAARLIYELKLSEHVTSVMKSLYWPPIKECVDYNVSPGRAFIYMSDIVAACADVQSFTRLSTSSSGVYVILMLQATVRWKSVDLRPSPDLLLKLKSTKLAAAFKYLLTIFFI